MRAEKVDFCVLVPASEDLFRFYGKRGFETAFYLNHTETGAEDIPLESSIDLRSIPLEDCFELRNSNFSGSALYCGWPKETLRFIDSECRYHGGETLQFAYNGRNGYAVCYPHGDALSVKECVPADTAQHILPALHKRYGKQHYHFRLPAGAEDGSGFGMVYWYSEAADLLKGSAPYLSLVLD